ncbi:MAG: phosphoribosylaminoimidazolesuccinocarboxamide synthase [Candidatus Omnitrophica bacterium]|nr:phosphoribosylaminoimidazolesuccinocarboxamide synthase [Candidatus Omnitrophota bacterium]MCM8776741.1 phosphoribosylaminoimidazolesuccinocarboxamide synthase [Candidatus Omnitrophota bacterium]
MENGFYDIEIPGIKKIYSGKVRELFEFDDKNMLMVATDRISAFDYILPTPIPEKGIILTKMSIFWFEYLKGIVKNHIVEHRFEKFPEMFQQYSFLKDRSVIVKKVKKVPIECVVRGYLAGSGWKEYKEKGEVCGVMLPSGLKESEKLPEPIFTPATKEEKGQHDINIDFSEMTKRVGEEIAYVLKEKSIEIYNKASIYAESKGIIIADTKFEFGIDENDKVILIDEVFTPDSSRFWEKEKYRPGISQDSLDKQYIRDYLLSTDWDRNSPPPGLPDSVVDMTVNKYRQIYHILTR